MLDVCPHCQIATPCDCDDEPIKKFRIKPRKRAGSFEQFVERYHPVELNDGLILREKENIPAHIGSRHIWTVVEGDNNRMYLVPGWSIVNRIGYVICDVPWCEVEYTNPGYVY